MLSVAANGKLVESYSETSHMAIYYFLFDFYSHCVEDPTEESVYVIDVFVYLGQNTRVVLVKTVRCVQTV